MPTALFWIVRVFCTIFLLVLLYGLWREGFTVKGVRDALGTTFIVIGMWVSTP